MKWTLLKLAAFGAVCLFFTGWLAFTIGNIHPFRGTYDLTATFDDVTGLLPNDNVKVAGVVVGKVGDIEIDQGKAKVRFSVKKGLKLPNDTEAAIRWRNLLGQRYVYLYPGSGATTLGDGDAIKRTRSVVDLGELFNRLGPIVQALDPKQVNAFLDTVVGALEGNEAKVSKALDDLAVLTQGLAARDEAIQRTIGNLDTVAQTLNSRDAQIQTVLENLITLAKTFGQNTDVLDAAVTDLDRFGENLTYLLSRNRSELDSLLTDLSTIADAVEEKLPTVDQLLGNLYEGSKRLFTSSRYGDWLNQIIPCGRIGYPPAESVSNCPDVGNFPGAPHPPTPAGASQDSLITTRPITGADAITSLLGGGR